MTGKMRIGLRWILLVAVCGHAALPCCAVMSGQGHRSFRADRPFQLPILAKVTETAVDGKGWAASGEIGVSFEQAQAQLAVKVSSSGWVHLHTIALGRDRVLDAWSRGDRELTVMAWRISPGKSGFSYGVSAKSSAKKLEKGKKSRS